MRATRGLMTMDLTTWMVANSVTDAKLAEAVGVTRPYINRIRKGSVHPSLGVALKIWKFAKRQIAIEQLLPIHERPKPTQPQAAPPQRGRPRKQLVPRASRSRAV